MKTRFRRAARSTLLSGALLLLLVLAGCGDPTGPGSCTPEKATLPSINHLQFTSLRDGRVIHLQRGNRNNSPTVRIWEQSEYVGEQFIPVAVHDIAVKLEQRLVMETWMGSVRQVMKMVPIAEYCSNRWVVQ